MPRLRTLPRYSPLLPSLCWSAVPPAMEKLPQCGTEEGRVVPRGERQMRQMVCACCMPFAGRALERWPGVCSSLQALHWMCLRP